MLPYLYLYLFADVEACKNKDFLGILPRWYKYLPVSSENNVNCYIVFEPKNGIHWALIGMAIVDILIRVAGLVALGYIIYGGIQYITSQGEPDATRAAQHTVTNAVIGLVIAIIGATVVSFIAKALG